MKKKVLTCVGTRPNLIKITQLHRCFQAYPFIEHKLLHTGQHFDYNMNDVFFKELGIKAPDAFLNINQGTQINVIARIMEAFEAFIQNDRPDLVMVPGDVNSSFACAFVAQRYGIPVAHIESGLRSFDMTMPEEANRLLIDVLADIYFVTEPSGEANLLRSGVEKSKIKYVGNTMIDALVAFTPMIDKSDIRSRLGVSNYYLLTFHRPINVDNKENLQTLAEIIAKVAEQKQVVFPVHPRTRRRLEEFGLSTILKNGNVILTDPIGYIDFINLVKNSSAVITDSGGVQEETTFMGVPCITVRPSTERPVTVTEGTNTLARLDRETILNLLKDIDTNTYKKGVVPYLWDGQSSERIAEAIASFFGTKTENASA
ncbi:MAG: UDP-N-acetylglucosamine 2-epimerase (non-hydrolyzing) [Chitinophagales bacterium]